MALFRARGLSLHTRNKKGQTPLLRIMPYEKKERILAVLEAGADRSIKDAKGKTALALAMEEGNDDCVVRLKSRSNRR